MMQLRKRSLSLLLVLCLLLGLTPAFAAGEVQVSTLEELQNALTRSGTEISLTTTITISSTTTLDLNGCQVQTQAGVSPAFRVTSGALLTVRGGRGSYIAAGDTAITLEGGSFTMESGSLTANNSSGDCRAILVKFSPDFSSSVLIRDGLISAVSDSNIASDIYFESSTGQLTITGGEIRAYSTYGNTSYAIRLCNNPLTITGGEVTCSVSATQAAKFPYALYRVEKTSNPFSITGGAQINGTIYVRNGLERTKTGLAGGIYASQRPNEAYLKSGCKVEDISQDPYFWKVTGGQSGSYSVAFNANGGQGEMETIAIPTGVAMTLPRCSFTWPGYTFLGWSLSSQGPVSIHDGDTVTDMTSPGSSVTLYAIWEKTRYIVTWYDAQGSTVLDSYAAYAGDLPVFHGEQPFLLGGSFQGWAERPGQTQGKNPADLPAIQGNVNYYAAFLPYVPDYLSLTWLDWEGSTVLAQETLAVNSQPTYHGETPALELTGYQTQFMGWNTFRKKSTGVPADQLPRLSDNASYYAAFALTPITYSLVFHSGALGQGTMEDQTFTYDQSQAISLNAFTPRSGYDFYHFAGWATTEGGEVVYQDGQEVVNLTAVDGETIHLYAVWELQTFQVRWLTYTGQVETVCDQMYGDAPYHPGPDPILMGAHFTGWADSPGQTQGQPVDALPAVTQDVDYYAAFSSAAPTRYTVTWLDRPGTGVYRVQGYVQNSLARYGTPDPEQQVKGYHSTFMGWSDKPMQDQPLTDAESFRVTRNLRFYAVFSLTPYSYHVSFQPSGGEGSMADQEFHYDESQALAPNGFTYVGKHLLGWATQPQGPVVYTDGQEVMNLTDQDGATVSLYAVWEDDVYTVTWRDFGSYVIGEDTYVYGQKPVYVREGRDAPWRAGANFAGWADAPFQTQGVPEEELPPVTGPVTYYAAFSSFYPEFFHVFWLDYTGYHGLSVDPKVGKGSNFVYSGPEPPAPDIDYAHNFTFNGWASQPWQNQGKPVEELGVVNQDTMWFAAFSWDWNSYQVRFNPNGGQGAMADQTFLYNEAAALSPAAFTREYHNFIGWSTTPDGKVVYQDGDIVKGLSTDHGAVVDLYAVWERRVHTVTWYDFWGTKLLGIDYEVYEGESPVFHKEVPPVFGGQFCGWNLHPRQNNGQETLPPLLETVTYFAAFSPLGNPDAADLPLTRTVTFMDYEGNTVLDSQVIYTSEVPEFHGAIPPYQITGYQTEYLGWSLQPEDDHAVELDTGTLDVTYYVALHREPNRYTIHFVEDYAAITAWDVVDIVAYYDQPVKLPTPFFTHYFLRFLGWDPHGKTNSPRYAGGATVVNLTSVNNGSVTLHCCCSTYLAAPETTDPEDSSDSDSWDSPTVVSSPVSSVTTPAAQTTYQVDLPAADPDTPVGQLPVATLTLAQGDSATVAYVKVGGQWTLVKEAYWSNGKLMVPVNGSCEVKIDRVERTYPDVDPTAWYADSVTFVSARDLFQGNGQGFAPDATMSRSMIAQVLFNLDRTSRAGERADFSDLDSGAWYADAVGWASGRNLMQGYGGAFQPDSPVTRQELVTILYRYAQAAGYEPQAVTPLTPWVDADQVAPWAADAVAWAVGKGILTGTGNGLLDPTGLASRAQVAALLHRFLRS